MKLTAIFESWHVGDGNYAPLSVGELVRLSFELEATVMGPADPLAERRFEHLGDARYTGVAQVLRFYDREAPTVAVLDAGDCRFYSCSARQGTLSPGDLVEFAGTLVLDHYAWVEFLHEYEDPPDLFYNLRVTRIQKVSMPERFISRSPTGGKAMPTRVESPDFGDVVELQTMENEEFDEEFYVIEFDGTGLEGEAIPLTFLTR